MISDSERAQRARRFLELLMSAEVEAANAVYDVLERGIRIEDVDEGYCAALHRVLVDWSVAEVEGLMRELGVKEIVVSAGQAPSPRSAADPIRPRGML